MKAGRELDRMVAKSWGIRWPSKLSNTKLNEARHHLDLGIGAGWNEVEYRMYGYPYDHRFERFQEAFTILNGLAEEYVRWS